MTRANKKWLRIPWHILRVDFLKVNNVPVTPLIHGDTNHIQTSTTRYDVMLLELNQPDSFAQRRSEHFSGENNFL